MSNGIQSKRNRLKRSTKLLQECGFSLSDPPPPGTKGKAYGAYTSIVDLMISIGLSEGHRVKRIMDRAKFKAGDKFNFYVTQQWREARYQALAANDGKCELCGHGKHDGKILHVDHIKPRSKFPELELRIMNLQVLCEDCNLGKSNKDYSDWREGAQA